MRWVFSKITRFVFIASILGFIGMFLLLLPLYTFEIFGILFLIVGIIGLLIYQIRSNVITTENTYRFKY